MTSSRASAAQLADAVVAGVRDDPAGRLRLMRALYESPSSDSSHLPYRRAMTAFMRWQLRRGLLEPVGAARPGSQWWRALNEAILRDIAESRHLVAGAPGDASSPAVEAVVDFIRRPSAALRVLYDWSARELGQTEVAGLLVGGIPAYAWDPAQASDWTPRPHVLTRLARRAVP